MYLTLSDVDICKAKEEGLKKLLKEYRFSKDVYRYPWLIIDDLLIQQQTNAKINKSKHLKGQLDPPVSDVMFFAPKEVSWTPLSVT